ncbi:ER membrane protein complex subunit 8 [Schistocerca americana]|uniref:ER membrane protein complex subunit 8 n=1 Tax=Schistocerca americana TaxID=7009 RepID=UPI001F4F80B0|nr:ER membrane protein complex subunit 8 [Schistocerca americana]XP_047111193.1 ER membrane protein complex subunit 8 [Schistocerca piceifrons]XP_049807846.1 ER membrane protein complex subunit 8 [Schistocerca nitens]XP_049956044.1 ER membrane protein complex subunit 8 [Schistocerca serialis cubense]
MAEIKFSARAYCKMILHAAKYPHCAINGLLLAEDSKSKDAKSKGLVITDAVPLFHICLQVFPMTEVALTQVDFWASKAGLVIAGYYMANENIRDMSHERGQRVADKIAENFSSACLVVINNQKLSVTMDNVALCVLQNADGKWKPKDRSSFSVEANSLDSAAVLVQQRAYEELVDFDNHLDDISLDWTNAQLNDIIDNAVQVVG